MATTDLIAKSLVYLDGDNLKVIDNASEQVKKAILAFLDMSSTATGQKTYYNKKSEQLDAMKDIHNAVYDINRGLYLAMLTLPGVMDISIQHGITKVLSDTNSDESILSNNDEAELIKLLSNNLKADRLLKMFGMICDNKINRRSVRTFILVSILSHRNLPWWSVKYRRHLLKALRHAWGMKYSSVISRILSGGIENASTQDVSLVNRLIDRYTINSSCPKNDIYESICYIFGKNINFNNEILSARIKARDDLSAGKNLPSEVLEGIRGRFHKQVDKEFVIQLSKNVMTDKDKLRKQRSAKKSGINLEFNASKLDAVSLYVYALEDGMTDDIHLELNEKASRAVSYFPLHYENAAIVLDTSLSMSGTNHNKNRPLAISLAIKDVIEKACQSCEIFCSGRDIDENGLVHASGDTSLAKSIAKAFMDEPDVVFLLTDGYENAPAGRVHEVMSAVRKLGINTPVYQFNPVMASEASGVRRLSDHISVLPISNPCGIGLSLIRAAIEQDIEVGLQAILKSTMLHLAS